MTSHRYRSAAFAVASVAALGALAPACDGSYQQFLSAVPQPAGDTSTPVQVLLGIDGMSRQAFDLARTRGAFAGWNVADLVTPFPGTSDYSWTRTLRAEPIGGYEIEYYDPAANQVVGAGLEGVAEHPLHEGIAGTYPCYQRFDFLGDGTTWQARGYLDPLGSVGDTLDGLFDTVAGRARTQRTVLAYMMTVDVVSHMGGLDEAAWTLVEIDRRIRAFEAAQEQKYTFTIFADHGNAHLPSQLVEPRDVLRDVGVAPVDVLSPDAPLEAVPIVHVRVNYVALHTHPGRVAEVAARSSTSASVDLAVAPLPAAAVTADVSGDGDGDTVRATAARVGADARWYGVWRKGQRYLFARDDDGAITVVEPARWDWLGAELSPFTSQDGRVATLTDQQAFAATLGSGYPDIFYRTATAFSDPAARHPADVLLSMPDDVASIGFEVPLAADIRANDGFHGSLSRAATMSVLASQTGSLPTSLRSDDLADMFPALAGHP